MKKISVKGIEGSINHRTITITIPVVVNLTRSRYDIYIGRKTKTHCASKWQNPFHIGKDGTREEVMLKFEDYANRNPELLSALSELEGKRLGCWCKPLPCHGDIYVKLFKERFGKESFL